MVDSPASPEDAVVVDKDPCVYCQQVPCDWETFGTEICEDCEALEEKGRTTKEIRHHAYRLYTRLRYGVLHKFDCRPLPVYVRGEIMDNGPEPNHRFSG